MGSSPNSGKSSSDFEEEVFMIPEAVGHAFDDLDLVVDAFEQAGMQRVAAMSYDARQVRFQTLGEAA